jgi:quercetin dioxygenase-like cupin family protein
VACKHYDAGAAEAAHVHRIATELTLIAAGRVTMNGRTYAAGDIIVLEPGEATDFRALEKTTTVVVKMPSVLGDKYPVTAGGAQ